ncbi:MAG: PAS domain S-box protein, partial [Candidatus Lokiarchaeota archaeon]|nr:PAS domain S-box protein [Candidatus Lokiarchaeota archaeon]
MGIDKNNFMQFFDDLDQFVYACDPKTYELIYLNKKFKEIARGSEADKICYKKLYNFDAPCHFCTNHKIFGVNSKSPYIWDFFNPFLKKWFHIVDQRIELKNRTLRLEIADEITKRKKVEEKLEFNSMLLNQIQDMITVTDLEGKIIYVNEASYQALKMSREDLIGKTVHFFGENPEVGATQQEIIDKTLSDGMWKGIIVNYAKDGTEQILETRTWLIKDEKSKPIGMIGISTDITKRKKIEEKLEESERRYREIVELLPDIVFEADKNLKLVFVNQIGFEKFGYESGIIPEDFKITDILVEGEEDRVKRHIKNIISGKLTKPGEYLFHKKNGEKFYGRVH